MIHHVFALLFYFYCLDAWNFGSVLDDIDWIETAVNLDVRTGINDFDAAFDVWASISGINTDFDVWILIFGIEADSAKGMLTTNGIRVTLIFDFIFY